LEECNFIRGKKNFISKKKQKVQPATISPILQSIEANTKNEVRTDALDIKVFYKQCNQLINCKVTQKTGSLVAELKKEILKKAALYQKQDKENKKK